MGVGPGVPVGGHVTMGVCVLPTQSEKRAKWSSGGWQSADFGSGSTLLWPCDLGLVPAPSGPKVPSSQMTVLGFMLQTPSLALQARQG